MNQIQEKWDQRWRKKGEAPSWQVDPWLLRVRPFLVPGTALDIACGMGRNALYLAQQGFQVTAVDISTVGLELLREEAGKRHLVLQTERIDLEVARPLLPAGPFDLLINFFYLHRPLLAQELARVRPGGLAVVRTFSQARPETFGTAPEGISLAPGELLKIFTGWQVLLHEEGLEPSAKGGSLAGIVARKSQQRY